MRACICARVCECWRGAPGFPQDTGAYAYVWLWINTTTPWSPPPAQTGAPDGDGNSPHARTRGTHADRLHDLACDGDGVVGMVGGQFIQLAGPIEFHVLVIVI